jgi:hypothetical protein
MCPLKARRRIDRCTSRPASGSLSGCWWTYQEIPARTPRDHSRKAPPHTRGVARLLAYDSAPTLHKSRASYGASIWFVVNSAFDSIVIRSRAVVMLGN